MTRALRLLGTTALAGAALFGARSATASLSYPGEVRRVVGLAEVPACTLCHLSDAGGDGTAVRPFGVAVVRLGALGNENLPSLAAALAALGRERTDSDADGSDDLTELRQGTDPNHGAGAAESEPPLTPMTGCSAAPPHRSSATILATVVALLTLRTRRQSRR